MEKIRKIGVKKDVKYFIGHKSDEQVKPLCIKLLKNVIRDITEKIGISDVMTQNKKILNNP